MNELDILFRDDFFLAVNKPSGLLVHRGWGKDRIVLVDLVSRFLRAPKAFPLHRIDRQTSGVVLFALSSHVAHEMGARFSNGGVSKRYLALVRGEAPESGHIEQPIPRREDGPRVNACTEYFRLAVAQTEPRHVSLVEARPLTGRLHQVRRHLKHINCPIIGDANYGKGPLNRAFKEKYGLERMGLHALSLEFVHPDSGTRCVIDAPLPDDFGQPLQNMGFEL